MGLTKRKQAQFYLFDAFFAATILLIGVGLLVGDLGSTQQHTPTQLLASDASTALTSQALGNIFNDYTTENFDILDEDLTPAQQIHVWWYNESCDWCMPNATALANSLLAPTQGEQHAVIVQLTSDEKPTHTVYNYTTIDKQPDLQIVNHQVLLTDTREGELLGPDSLEVRVWR